MICFLFASIFNFVNAQNRMPFPYDSRKDADNLQKLTQAYIAIAAYYVDKTDDNQILEDAIKGMLEKLDPHSSYSNVEETRSMKEQLTGNFHGIGIQFNMLTDTLYITEVISGGPSEKVGLLAGDRIIMVDDSLIAGVKMGNADVIKRIRGEKGTEVRIQVKRGELPYLMEFKIIRDVIPIYSLEASYMADKNTGYIRLSRFSETTATEFEDAFKKLKKEGMNNLILDLQGNGGGLLLTALKLCDEFIENDKLIVYTEGNRSPRFDAKTTENGLFKKGKLIVLVDEYSASASEIVSGAIQDWDRGVIVGRRTFGKGLVQRPIELPDSSMIRLTIARYYTPSGRFIQKPYEKGNMEAYKKDWIDRYNNGELIHADSIHFPDSLKYTTLMSKRTVYGGGGIMPDVFIPFDSTRTSEYHFNLVRLNIINRINMGYVDKHREELKKNYPDLKKFKKDFVVSEEMLQDMLQMAEEEKIEFNEEQYNHSKGLISLQLKALIARDLFESGAYFYVMNDRNDSYQKALQIINDDTQYYSLLNVKK